MELGDVIGLAGVPFIAALVQVAKAWVAEDRYYPLLALAVGLILNIGIALARSGDLPTAVVLGLVAGLAASGLYSGGKTLARV
ncbi:MAG: hypothetical protein Q8P59_03365 [Dehalococcoidia bacterium]|nr:hypothetical protein [Dehalococcoidia bacterium]